MFLTDNDIQLVTIAALRRVLANNRQRDIDLVAKHLACQNKRDCDFSTREESCLEVIIAEILAGDK